MTKNFKKKSVKEVKTEKNNFNTKKAKTYKNIPSKLLKKNSDILAESFQKISITV